jgi:hypothetical protein
VSQNISLNLDRSARRRASAFYLSEGHRKVLQCFYVWALWVGRFHAVLNLELLHRLRLELIFLIRIFGFTKKENFFKPSRTRFRATISIVSRFLPLNTVPYVPSPIFSNFSYFCILLFNSIFSFLLKKFTKFCFYFLLIWFFAGNPKSFYVSDCQFTIFEHTPNCKHQELSWQWNFHSYFF